MTAASIRTPLDLHPRLFFAEDDEDLRNTVTSTLREAGWNVVPARDGVELLALLSAAARGSMPKPDVVASDIRMPGPDGLDLLRAVKLAEWETPMVLLTAFGDRRTHERAKALGAFALLDKPISIGRLVTVLDAAVASRLLPALECE